MKPVINWLDGTLCIQAGIGWLTFSSRERVLGRLRGRDSMEAFARAVDTRLTQETDQPIGPGLYLRLRLDSSPTLVCEYGIYTLEKVVLDDVSLWCRGEERKRLARNQGRIEMAIGNNGVLSLTLTDHELAELAALCADVVSFTGSGSSWRLAAVHDHSSIRLQSLIDGRFKLTTCNGVFSRLCSRAELAQVAVEAACLAREAATTQEAQ